MTKTDNYTGIKSITYNHTMQANGSLKNGTATVNSDPHHGELFFYDIELVDGTKAEIPSKKDFRKYPELLNLLTSQYASIQINHERRVVTEHKAPDPLTDIVEHNYKVSLRIQRGEKTITLRHDIRTSLYEPKPLEEIVGRSSKSLV